MTIFVSFSYDLGKPSTKSIVMSCQEPFGIGRGYNNPFNFNLFANVTLLNYLLHQFLHSQPIKMNLESSIGILNSNITSNARIMCKLGDFLPQQSYSLYCNSSFVLDNSFFICKVGILCSIDQFINEDILQSGIIFIGVIYLLILGGYHLSYGREATFFLTFLLQLAYHITISFR